MACAPATVGAGSTVGQVSAIVCVPDVSVARALSPPPDSCRPVSAAFGDHDPPAVRARSALAVTQEVPRLAQRGCCDTDVVSVPSGFATVCEYAVWSVVISTVRCSRRAVAMSAIARGTATWLSGLAAARAAGCPGARTAADAAGTLATIDVTARPSITIMLVTNVSFRRRARRIKRTADLIRSRGRRAPRPSTRPRHGRVTRT